MFIVTGAYGRKYKTAEDVKRDWEQNRDFYIVRGSMYSYINKKDWEIYDGRMGSVYFVNDTLRVTLAMGLLA